MAKSHYHRLLDEGLAHADATPDEVQAINDSLTGEDVDRILEIHKKLPKEATLTLSRPQPAGRANSGTP